MSKFLFHTMRPVRGLVRELNTVRRQRLIMGMDHTFNYLHRHLLRLRKLRDISLRLLRVLLCHHDLDMVHFWRDIARAKNAKSLLH